MPGEGWLREGVCWTRQMGCVSHQWQEGLSLAVNLFIISTVVDPSRHFMANSPPNNFLNIYLALQNNCCQ